MAIPCALRVSLVKDSAANSPFPPTVTAPDPELLDDDAYRAARLVALGLMQRVREARPRLADAKDSAALHDFRVVVRRLRSWLTLQAPLLGDSAPRKVQRWLRRLAKSTNPTRDDEVFSEWLTTERGKIATRHRGAADWLVRRLALHRRRSAAALAKEIDRDLDRSFAVLDERLPFYDVPHHIEGGSRAVPFAAELAAMTRTQSAALRRRLSAIRGPEEVEAVHRARIAGKRLRYLLEPIETLVAEGPAAIAQLKTLQDLLGDHHDAYTWLQTLRAALPRAQRLAIRTGLRAIDARIEQRSAERFLTLQGEWLAGEAPLFALLERLAAALEARGRRGFEIERKYLLSALPATMPGARVQRIEQGYLPGERLVERLRRVRSGRTVKHLRTVKAGAGVARLEVEEECAATLFASLWPLTKGRRVLKRRHLVPNDALTWAIDEFTDRDLVLAEIELPTTDAAVVIPPWLTPHVVREVTDEPAYVNAVLAN